MHRRHFVVCCAGDTPKFKEIDAALATRLRFFGVTQAQYTTLDMAQCTFYFLTPNLNRQRAHELAAQLINDMPVE